MEKIIKLKAKLKILNQRMDWLKQEMPSWMTVAKAAKRCLRFQKQNPKRKRQLLEVQRQRNGFQAMMEIAQQTKSLKEEIELIERLEQLQREKSYQDFLALKNKGKA